MLWKKKTFGIGALCLSLSAFGISEAMAQTKTAELTILIGTAAGGSFDLVGRIVSRTLVTYIPGSPSVVPQNMPGAGSMIAANYLFNVAPQDGSVIGVINPALAFNQIFDNKNARFDVAKFNWIGSPVNSLIVIPIWHTSPIKTWQDATRLVGVVGAPVPTSPDAMSFYMMNHLLGTKFKVVTGYKGGKDLDLAIERGEIIGRGGQSWSGLKALHPDWIHDKKISPIMQIGLQPASALPNVPLLSNILTATDSRQVADLYSASTAVGRPLVMGPRVPAATVAIMRKAFLKTMNDPGFLADAHKAGLEIEPISGEDIQREMDKFHNLSAKVIELTKKIVGQTE